MHGPEKIPNETFSLWNMIRDALDPLHESKKIKVKGEEKDTDSKPNYQQLREMLAAMNTNSHLESRDEKEETRKRHPFLDHVAGVQLMEKVKKPCHFLLR